MAPLQAQKKALCIGISYRGQQGPNGCSEKDWELEGVHGDVEKICGLLTAQYGYERQNINILQDCEGYASPTRDNILAAMGELVESATPGGSLFFFFAGHSDQIPNLDGTERDFMDEIILPLDWQIDESRPPNDRDRYSVKIIDDELNDILVKMLPPDCRLTALFDSCHSGTMLDLPFTRSYGPRANSPTESDYMTEAPRTQSPESQSPVSYRPSHFPRPQRETRVVYSPDESASPQVAPLQDPEDVVEINRVIGRGPLDLSYTIRPAFRPRGKMDPQWRKGTWILRGESLDTTVVPPPPGANAVSWSACDDSQNGYECTENNQTGGLMVKAFVELLMENPHRTYRDMLTNLGERLRFMCDRYNQRRPKEQWVIQEPQSTQTGASKKRDLLKPYSMTRKQDLDEMFEP